MISDLLREKGYTLTKKTGKEYSAACPFCGGVDRFCVWPEKDRYWCRQCNRKGDSIQLLRDLDGMTFNKAKEALRYGHSDGSLKRKSPQKKLAVKLKKGKKTFVHPELGKPDCLWKYVDEEGQELFAVARFDNNGDKKIRQCLPDGLSWSINGIRKVLFNLPAVLKAKCVWMCEGEKCVDTLTSLGFKPSTTSPMGAGKWPNLYKEYGIGKPLHGKTVKVLLHWFKLLISLEAGTDATGVYKYRYFYTYLHWFTL